MSYIDLVHKKSVSDKEMQKEDWKKIKIKLHDVLPVVHELLAFYQADSWGVSTWLVKLSVVC